MHAKVGGKFITRSSAESSCLWDPVVGTRRKAEWDDHGEAYSSTQEGPDIWISIKLPGGLYHVSFYFNAFRDHEHAASRQYRDLLIAAKTESDQHNASPTSSTTRVMLFHGGVFKSFVLSGNHSYRFEIHRNFGYNTIVNAVFVDRLSGAAEPADALPMSYTGGVPRLVPPSVRTDAPLLNNIPAYFGADSRSALISYFPSLCFMRLLYRSAMPSDSEDILQYLRWKANLWSNQDRTDFDKYVRLAWRCEMGASVSACSSGMARVFPFLAIACAALLMMAQEPGGVPASPKPAPKSHPTVRGAVGVGTYSTAAQFKDIGVTSLDGKKALLRVDVRKGLSTWFFNGGEWKTLDDTLKQSSFDKPARATVGDTAWTDYVITLKAKKIAGDEGFLVLFRVRDNTNYVWFNIGGWSNTKAQVETTVGGKQTAIGPSAPFSVVPDRWYDLKVEVEGETASCFVDSKLICKTDISEVPATAAPVNQTAGTNGGNSAQDTQAQKNTAHQQAIRDALNAGDKTRITKAINELKAWYVEDEVNAEHSFWGMRAQFAGLIPDRPSDVLDLIDLAWGSKSSLNGDHSDPGYLYAMKSVCLFEQHKINDAQREMQQGLALDPVHTSEEFMSYIAQAPAAKDAGAVLVDVLPAVIVSVPEDPNVVEPALKLRINLLDSLGRYEEALSDARWIAGN